MVRFAGAAAAGAKRNVSASDAGAGSVSDITEGKAHLERQLRDVVEEIHDLDALPAALLHALQRLKRHTLAHGRGALAPFRLAEEVPSSRPSFLSSLVIANFSSDSIVGI